MNDGQAVSISHLAAIVIERAKILRRVGRFVVGIAGPPAAGKSILAESLRDEVNDRCADQHAEIAPMDGFHLYNTDLVRLGKLENKGEPDTFDVHSYVDRLGRVREGLTVWWPTYDRIKHDPTPKGVLFDDNVNIAITEGNYLLLNKENWSDVRRLLDFAWYLDGDANTMRECLIDRQLNNGKTDLEALHKVEYSDLANARLVATTRHYADQILFQRSGIYYID